MSAAVFSALGDPLRYRIVERLASGPATPTQLCELQEITLTGLLKHLDVLQRAGLLERHKSGREVTCTLRTEPLDTAQHWLRDRVGHGNRILDRSEPAVTAAASKETP